VEVARLNDVPTSEALAQFLQERGLDTTNWGQGNTKHVSQYWKEIKLDEAGLEIWRTREGKLQTVRTTHVLRAKVCSPENYERDVFLFNTWQQYGDGRTRTRNGLLSEKLSMEELPLEDHLHEVCERAVTEEEMQRVVESALKIGPGVEAPAYDPSYVCPLKVVNEKYIDHIIEIEISKSYPGLLTMYHLYTVDIICTGLPKTDLNTLEFDHPDKEGHRNLKYIHAWVWLPWRQIQRYLFEGSKQKEKKGRGSFKSPEELGTWLGQFHLNLDEWGVGSQKSIEDLFDEVENQEALLELWGRHDGAALLVRVVHVIQLTVRSSDARLSGKFLFNTWQQTWDGKTKQINRLLAKKQSISKLPFDEARFSAAVADSINEEMAYIADTHYQVRPSELPRHDDLERSTYEVRQVKFVEHRNEVEESPSFKGIHTMYHLYTMDCEVDGLPLSDFATLGFEEPSQRAMTRSSSSLRDSRKAERSFKAAHGWRWVTWQQVLNIMHVRTQTLEREKRFVQAALKERRKGLDDSVAEVAHLKSAVERLAEKVSPDDPDVREATRAAEALEAGLGSLTCVCDVASKGGDNVDLGDSASALPPSMVSKLSEQTVATSKFLEEHQWAHVQEAMAKHAIRQATMELIAPLETTGLGASTAARGNTSTTGCWPCSAMSRSR